MRCPRRIPFVLLLVALGVLPLLDATQASADWGGDVPAGEGPKMVEEVRTDLLRILGAAEDERAEKVASFLARGGRYTIEGLKRYRNPELAALFQAFLDHPDWHVQHRGLLALERLGDPALVLDRALLFLQHPERRIRERAALTAIALWDGRDAPADLDELRHDERDPHVQRCLAALAERAAGTLPTTRLREESIEVLDDTLRRVPFARDPDEAMAAWEGVPAIEHTSSASASRLAPADRWTWPLLGYGEEEVPGSWLEPYGNLGLGGSVHHVGQDVGACLDGAGLYAPAAGIVKRIRCSAVAGTEFVIEHRLPGGRLSCSLLLHAAPLVFVEAGQTVRAGQLIGSVGLGFSAENGGRLGHLHFGLYPGPFDPKRSVATTPVAEGLAAFFDPTDFLPAWMERTHEVVPELFPPSAALAGAVAKANNGDYGRAFADALKRRDRAERRSREWADADEIVQAVKGAPRAGLRRANALIEGGYPKEALAFLKELASACKGMPGVERVERRLDEWKEDDAIRLALKGQAKVEKAEQKALKERNPDKVRALFEKLLDDYAGTCLEDRIRAPLRRMEAGR